MTSRGANVAQGFETTVTAELGGEEFTARGLAIRERNYLDVYPYDQWSENSIPDLRMGAYCGRLRATLLDVTCHPADVRAINKTQASALTQRHWSWRRGRLWRPRCSLKRT
jgi:hypothetical protein